MEVLHRNPQAAEVRLTRGELAIINNALNEICNGLPLEDVEFQTRIGFSREVARQVLGKVAKALKA